MANISLYFHIPFCARKCPYCGFFSRSNKSQLWQNYFEALKVELLNYKSDLKDTFIDSIYIGGGTPTLVPADNIYHLLKTLESNFCINKNCEITLECNPESLTKDKLLTYQKSNINRLSIGIQTTNRQLLREIGRNYTFETVKEKYQLVRKLGFNNINLDLIFGFPKQSLESFETDLQNIIELNPEHIACYGLELDEKSYWGRLNNLGKFEPVSNELNRQMYHMAIKLLKKAGYKHYEISNWAKLGFECRHNYSFWQYQPYIGIGAGAHSFCQFKRWSNVENIERYIVNINRHSINNNKKITTKKVDIDKEKLMLGLRLREGIDQDKLTLEFVKKFDPFLTALINEGLLTKSDNTIYLTEKGLDVENQVIKYFFDAI